jgi:hypothetical protein
MGNLDGSSPTLSVLKDGKLSKIEGIEDLEDL